METQTSAGAEVEIASIDWLIIKTSAHVKNYFQTL